MSTTSTGSPSASLNPAEATAVLMVRQGMPLAEAARVSGLTSEQITHARERADANRGARPMPPTVAPAPTRSAPVAPVRARPEPSLRRSVDAGDLLDIEELLGWADKAGVNRAAMLAERIRSATSELRSMAKRQGEIAQRKAIVAALEKQLAKARAELHESTGEKRRPADGAPARKGETAQIRAWAQANGYEVALLGRIPAPIVEAYHAAHRGGADS
jgi:hypothetical protein